MRQPGGRPMVDPNAEDPAHCANVPARSRKCPGSVDNPPADPAGVGGFTSAALDRALSAKRIGEILDRAATLAVLSQRRSYWRWLVRRLVRDMTREGAHDPEIRHALEKFRAELHRGRLARVGILPDESDAPATGTAPGAGQASTTVAETPTPTSPGG